MAAREAYDLFHPACRQNFSRRVRTNWRYLSFWRLVALDTVNRVCSKRTPHA